MIIMNLNRALSLAVFAGFTSFVSMVGSLTAQTYPSKPIRVVVPVTPGPLDTLARLLSERMQEQFRQPFIIENRPGAGGNIGAELVAKSSPDAYTLLYAIDTTFTVNPSLYRKSNFDYEKDFSPVTLIGEFGLVLAVNPQFPANNLQDFIELGKRRALSYGSSGNGSPAHLAFAYFQNVAGIKGNHVPYKGATQSVTDLLAGQIDSSLVVVSAVAPHIRAGKLRGLGVSVAARSPLVPEVPTIAELGFPGFDVGFGFLVMVPAATPEALVNLLHGAIKTAMEDPRAKQNLLVQGINPMALQPKEARDWIRKSRTRWASVVQQSQMSLD